MVPIQNEVLTINYEHPSSEDQFERKFQDKIYPSDNSFEKQEEEFTEFKEEHHDELRNVSSVLIINEVLIINYEHQYSEDYFERKFQAKLYPYEQSLEKQKKN